MTVDEIYSQMVQTFQTETGLALAGDGDMAVRLYAAAAQLYALYVQADWVARQCFPQTALGDYLDRHAQLRGLERRAAVAAEGVLRFSVPSAPDTDLSIPEGTVCMTAAQVRFETLEAGVLQAGDTSVDVRAGSNLYIHIFCIREKTLPGVGKRDPISLGPMNGDSMILFIIIPV